jgi:hypothetical protein
MAARPPPPLRPPPLPSPQERDEPAAQADVEGLSHYASLGFSPQILDQLRLAGCDPSARLRVVTARDVREAWLRAARRLHPDKQRRREEGGAAGKSDGDTPTAATAFVRARLAYDVLGNARSRKAYDLLGAEAGLAAARAGGGGGSGAAPTTGGLGGGGGGSGGWARGAAGAVPVTVWYGDEEGDDVVAAGAAAAAAHEAALCVEDMVRRLVLEQEQEEEGGGVAAQPQQPQQHQPLTAAFSLDPSRQLALLCELCPRPSSRTCWTCGAALCAFCSRRPHYALHGAPLGHGSNSNNRRRKKPGLVRAHYPLVDAPGSMAETLGKQDWEHKRLEDARRAIREAPGYRGEAETRALRAFLEEEDSGGRRYYRWCVSRDGMEARLAVLLPTGGGAEGEEGGAAEARVELEGGGGNGGGGASPLLLSAFSAGAAKKVIDRRRLALPVRSSEGGIEVRSVAGGRAVVVRLPLDAAALSSSPLLQWRLFAGDEPGARRRWPSTSGGSRLYSLIDEEEDDDQQGGGVRVVFEGLLPWWVDAREDVEVDCFFRVGGGEEERGGNSSSSSTTTTTTATTNPKRLGLRVRVAGVIDVRRAYSTQAAAALGDEARCAWWCEEDGGGGGGGNANSNGGAGQQQQPLNNNNSKSPPRSLSVFIPLRPSTAEERSYKAGVRQDHRAAPRRQSPLAPWLPRRGGNGTKGVAFFEEDEDEFGLDALLEAVEDELK